MRKNRLVIFTVGLFLIMISAILVFRNINKINFNLTKVTGSNPQLLKQKDITAIKVDKIIVNSDENSDGILDLDEIVLGARLDAENKPKYTNKYYVGGYPPDDEGVCTDVVWRAFKKAGYNLKNMVDKDIKANLKQYPRVEGKPDPNIDFRRVPNLVSFFTRNGEILTLDLKAGDSDNLKLWQGGDIVTFDHPQHVAIISDKRRVDGIPYIIHNAGPFTLEEDKLLKWMPKITGHFRYPK